MSLIYDFLNDAWTDLQFQFENGWDLRNTHFLIDCLLVLTPFFVLGYFITYILSERRKQRTTTTTSSSSSIGLDQQAQARFQLIQEQHQHQLQQHLDTANEQGDSSSLNIPKRLGKKKAKHLEAKENLRRYRDWQASQEREKQYRRELLDEVKEKQDREKEKLRLREEAKRLALQRDQEKKRKAIQAQLEQKEAAKPSVFEKEAEILTYVKTKVVLDVNQMASDLGLRSKELHSYVYQKLDQQDWLGQLDNQGKLIYLDPARLALLQSILNQQGMISSKEAINIFTNKQVSMVP